MPAVRKEPEDRPTGRDRKTGVRCRAGKSRDHDAYDQEHTDFADKAKSAAHTAKATWDRAGETKKKTERKKKSHLFEETTFEGRDAAQEFLDKNAATMKRSKLGLQVAVIASIFIRFELPSLDGLSFLFFRLICASDYLL